MLCERRSKEPTMNFPGACKLQLTDDAIKRAVEDALNAARREGEDYIHVTEFSRVGYGHGDWVATITTDHAPAVVMSINAEEA
jgi:hypothetical protein